LFRKIPDKLKTTNFLSVKSIELRILCRITIIEDNLFPL
jgi:hypothetical protein